MVVAVLIVAPRPVEAAGATLLTQDDFRFGTYIIDTPGTYRLAENISFNPNSPETLEAALASGEIPADTAAAIGLSSPVDAYQAGWPLASQFVYGPSTEPFTPGGPLDARYDPAAYGVGFFAAIAVSADDVVIDLSGYTIEQSAEHALLQRFFAVIELADQPFIPAQGPAGFGDELVSANNVRIRNGTIGRSSHHGIHGNTNVGVVIRGVDFVDYEVAAVALNGVDGLHVSNSDAINRKDVPVLGTYSSARFISRYIDQLVRAGSTTTLTVGGATLNAADVQLGLRNAINNVHDDVIVDGLGVIDAVAHPDDFALFHNRHGLVDGNSYSFVVNRIGVAVNGFPTRPTGEPRAASNARFVNVHVIDQHAAINEVPAIDDGSAGGGAVIDPIGAVFQTQNLDPVTGDPVTISSLDPDDAHYVGNAVANAQAFVAKAVAGGDPSFGHLDTSRVNFPVDVLRWVEGDPTAATLTAIGAFYRCNGDSMFHVNKGAIGFKMDAVSNVDLVNTSVDGLVNLGSAGTAMCGEDISVNSHPAATLNGYGGAAVRGYTFAGSDDVYVRNASADRLESAFGPASGFAVLTDTAGVRLVAATAETVIAGSAQLGPTYGPNNPALAVAIDVSAEAEGVVIIRACGEDLQGVDGQSVVSDPAGVATVRALC